MAVSEQTYQRVALEDPDRKWELHCGRLVEKPAMTFKHGDIASYLCVLLQTQLDRRHFRVHVNHARLRWSETQYFVPDVAVIPMRLAEPLLARSDVLESYDEPLPLIVEVWSPSTGDYDVTDKLPEYRRRADLEIWFIHPYERTLRAWRRQPDGSYRDTLYTSGSVQPAALPGVSIELTALFE